MAAPDLDIDVLVIGGGVIGLACGAAVAERGLSLALVERHAGPGRETSSRNSEVIHAGLYYPPGSLRAQHCVRGSALLYAFCRDHGVAARAIGKLVVAVDEQELPALHELFARGQANGARELRLVSGREVRELEPAVRACAGLVSPSTGIVDTHGLMKALEAKLREAGGELLYRCQARAIEPVADAYRIVLENPAGREVVRARAVVNAAGLEADRVARLAGVEGYQLHWCKGDYFAVSRRVGKTVSRLIYPVPAPQNVGLGVHVTLDLGGRMRLGPDATYVDRDACDLDVDPGKAATFLAAARRFLPALREVDLEPDMAGVRPKTQGPGDPWADFIIREESAAGRPRLINLIGIDSPGLTSCLSIADAVADSVGDSLGSAADSRSLS